jgi:hypothetical protein
MPTKTIVSIPYFLWFAVLVILKKFIGVPKSGSGTFCASLFAVVLLSFYN